MRPRVNNNSNNRRTHSVANSRIFKGQEVAPPPDRRGVTNNRARQGPGICSVCSIEVQQRKVSYNNPSRLGDLPNDSLVAGQHRHGGGNYSARRGDVLCAGAGTPVSRNP